MDMSTNSGISKYDKKNDTFVTLDITDGLQSNCNLMGMLIINQKVVNSTLVE